MSNFPKNILTSHVIFGRLLCALLPYYEELAQKQTPYLTSSQLSPIIAEVYARGEVNKTRRNYIRVFVRQNFRKIQDFRREVWRDGRVGEDKLL